MSIEILSGTAESALAGLTVFQGVRNGTAAQAFFALVQTAARKDSEATALVAAWSRFVAQFVREAGERSFADYWAACALRDENDFTVACERGDVHRNALLLTLVKDDFKRLSTLAACDIAALGAGVAARVRFANLNEAANLIENEAAYFKTATESGGTAAFALEAMNAGNATAFGALAAKNGAGVFADYCFFYWERGAGVKPALNRDTITLDELSGYEEQRKVIRDNTLRFLDGRVEVNNILLYGDRGTGKSATVKAVCNSFAARGLRLIELRKQDADDLPALINAISRRGLHFVIFIDDLSFESQNDSFNTLKALLEGGIEARPKNAVIYATSNRRHLVKEKARDRPDIAAAAASAESGDMRAFDTMQEQLSLSDRFGVTVVFSAPSQDAYLKIAEFLGRRAGALRANVPPDELKAFYDNALKWERWFNGRSPRTARQYVNWLKGGERFPWE